MRLSYLLMLVMGLLVMVGVTDARSAERVALIIGNSSYKEAPRLKNPANDADDLSRALRSMGFDVIERIDATRGDMAEAIRDFAQRIRGSDIAFFYYAGHGMHMDDENYLIPIDARIEDPTDVRFSTISLADLQQEMAGARRATIIVLDACRNNPFTRKLSGSGRAIGERGLQSLDASGRGSLIVYSTQPNSIALDGDGRNSPFAAALVRHIGEPNVEIRRILSDVRSDVLAATDEKQVPWDSSSLVGDVYLSSTREGEPSAQSATSPSSSPAPAAAPAPPPLLRQEAASPAADECERLAGPVPLFATPEEVKASHRARDWARALAVCTEALTATPNVPRLHYLLGEARLHQKDYLNAQRELNIAAEAGDSDAQLRLGFMFATGTGTVKDYYRAFGYFEKAAAAGNARAMTNLGSMYSNGWGTHEDDAQALALYEKAIELGNPFALAQAGVMYFNGKGVPRDYAAAEQYFQQAADLGDGYAMKFLAILYEHGLVGPADATKAGQLRLRAAEEDPDSTTPVVTWPKNPTRLTHHLRTTRRIVFYRWHGDTYNPAWQAAPGDTRCCPKNMLVCPLGRHWCG